MRAIRTYQKKPNPFFKVFNKISVFLHSVRFKTTLHLHLKASKNKWYKKWHDFRYSHHIHSTLAVAYATSVFVALLLNIINPQANVLAANGSWSQTSFSGSGDGTYTNTSKNSDGTSVGLSETKFSNDGGGDWNYRKKITIDNSAGGVLTDYQVAIDSEKDLAAHWNFDETSGTAYDSSWSGANCANAGGVTFSSGKYGNASDFNESSTDYLNCGTNTNSYFNNGNSWTIDGWVYPTVTPAATSWHWIASKAYTSHTSPYYQFDIRYTDTGAINATFWGIALSVQSTSNSVPLNKWTHYSVAVDTNSKILKLYLNGFEVASDDVSSGTYVNYGSALSFGQNINIPTSTIYTFKGKLDETKIYKKALSASEVLAGYQNTNHTNSFNRFQSDGDDIRITDSDGKTEIPYWLESFNNLTTGKKNYKVWTKVPSIGASVTKDIFMYYGNQSATSSSNGTNTFLKFSSGVTGSILGMPTNSTGYIIEASVTASALSTEGPEIFFDQTGNGAERTNIDFVRGANQFRRFDYTADVTAINFQTYSYSFPLNTIVREKIIVKNSSYWFYLNNTLILSNTNLPYTQGNAYFGGWSTGDSGTFNSVFVRQYSALEPSISDFGGLAIQPYKKDITFNTSVTGANVATAQYDFPIAVHINSSSIPDTTERSHFFGDWNVGGKRVQFWESDESIALDYEVEYYDSATQEAIYWVRVPKVDGNSTTDKIKVAYGRSPVADQDNQTGVWLNGFAMVQHLGNNSWGSSPEAKDSSGNSNNGTNVGSTDTAAMISRGRSYNGSSKITILDANSLSSNSLTVEAWVNPAVVGNGVFISKYSAVPCEYELAMNATSTFIRSDNSANSAQYSTFTGALTAGSWYYLAGTINNTEGNTVLTSFRDGIAATSSSAFTRGSRVSDPLWLGGRPYTGAETYFNGILDEVRISQISRSNDWLKLTYYSNKKSNFNGDSWLSYSSESAGNYILVGYQTSGTFVSVAIPSTLAHQGKIYGWGNFTFANTLNSQNITYDILNGDTGNVIPGYTGITVSPADLSGISAYTYPSIKLRANFYGDGISTPYLNDWALAYSYDLTAPSVPSNLQLSAISDSQISLSWTASSDAESGLAGYDIERAPDVSGSPGSWVDPSGTCAGTISSINCIDQNLSSNTKYYYRVRAIDHVGNNSNFFGEPYSVVIQPLTAADGYDNQMYKTSPSNNYGSATAMYIGELNDRVDGITRALIKFDIAGNIPPGMQITSAELSLYTTVELADNASTYRVYRSKKSWSETASTWNNYNTGFAWESPGGFGASDAEQTDIGSRNFGASETLNQWKNFTLDANAINEMYIGSFTNNGFLIKSDLELNDAYYFMSSDALNYTPKLTINYGAPIGIYTLPSTPTLSDPVDYTNDLTPSDIGGSGTSASVVVKLYKNNGSETEISSTTADGSGSFTFDSWTGNLDEGLNNIYVKAFNTEGASIQSNSQTIGLDTDLPEGPSVATAKESSDLGADLINNDWNQHNNGPTVYFEWSGHNDLPIPPNSSIKRHWVYFGPNANALPRIDGVATLSANPNTVLTLSSPETGTDYYFRVQSEDEAGNISPDIDVVTIFTYKFDDVAPQPVSSISVTPPGWSTDDPFTFTWADGTDGESGLYGYDYKRNNGIDNWTRIANASPNTVNIDHYQTGVNYFLLATVDRAGNQSTSVNWPYLYSGNVGAPQNLSVDLSQSQGQTVNRFKFTWDPPLLGNTVGYYYSVNSTPSSENSTYSENPFTDFGAFAKTNGASNTFYVVAKDEYGNIGWNNYAQTSFIVNTVAPGAPRNISITDTSNRNTGQYALTLMWLPPETETTDFSHYVVERSTDGNNFVERATLDKSNTGYLDTGLSNLTDYYYRVKSKDNVGNVSEFTSVVHKVPTGKYTTPPSFTSDPSSDAKAMSVKISWTTNRASNTIVQYGTTESYGQEASKSTEAVTDHSIEILGLTPGMTYHYRVQSLDAERDYDPNLAFSDDFTFSTQAAPGISNVEVSEIRLTSAIITWKTTSSATSKILYGTTTAYGKQYIDNSGSAVTTHTVKLDSLSDSTTYNFKIQGTDVDDNNLLSDNYVFTTLTFPRLSNLKIEQVKNTATSTVKVRFDSNVPTTANVNVSGNGGKESAQYNLKNTHEMTISGLKDNTLYTITASARDQYGNEANPLSEGYKTEFDTRPPEISGITTETSIIGYGTEAKGQIIISWTTDEPSTSQIEYASGATGSDYSSKTQEDNSLTQNHVVIISDLKPSSPYHFRVISHDNAGNKAQSSDNSVLTDQANESIIDVIIKSLQSTIGWIFNVFAK